MLKVDYVQAPVNVALLAIGVFGAAQVAAQAPTDRRPEAARAFATCVENQAAILEAAGDPISEVVQTAFTACRYQEAELLFAIIDNRERAHPTEPREQREDVALRVVNEVKADITEEARLAAMRARASRNAR